MLFTSEPPQNIVRGLEQVEADKLYVSINKIGVHYLFPVQAKSSSHRLSIVQVEQDIAFCTYKFSLLTCRPIAAQFMRDDVIALFESEQNEGNIGIASEKYYKLVLPEEVTDADLATYRSRTVS